MRIAVSANYTIPTTLSKVATKDGLFIDVDTTGGAVEITLPPIGTYPNEITVVDDGGNAGTNAITVKADATVDAENYVEGAASVAIDNDSDSITFKPVTDIDWGNSKTGASSSGAGIGESWTESIVNITAAQILAMQTTPIQLAPAPGVGKYYDAEVILEYSHVTTTYDTTGVGFLSVRINNDPKNIGVSMLQTASDKFVKVATETANGANDLEGAAFVYGGAFTNQAIELTTWNAANPTLGNGTIRAIVRTKVRTFGA